MEWRGRRVAVRPSRKAPAVEPAVRSQKTRILLGMPASRSWVASSTEATASTSTPQRTRWRATGTAPWPYASALTTAHSWTWGPVIRRISAVLWESAARSIFATARWFPSPFAVRSVIARPEDAGATSKTTHPDPPCKDRSAAFIARISPWKLHFLAGLLGSARWSLS